jgi:hypothetical protein
MEACMRRVAVLGVLCCLLPGTLYAEEGQHKPPALSDCRYERQADGAGSTVFPTDDVFRPLLADPKQPQTFATWQVIRSGDDRTSANVGSVALGENFGFYTKRDGCNGWQVSLLTGIFSQFNMDAPSTELINTDFIVGIPVSWRSGNWSTRVRYYHQSSHLGDEFLLGRPGFNRLNFSFEEIEAIISYDYRWARLYAGGGYLIHREPVSLDRNRVQWGVELRGPASPSRLMQDFYDAVLVTPVLAADFKAFEELQWLINWNVVGGFEWSRAGSLRRFRIMLNYYRGYNPYGQFFAQKIDTFGAGLYFMF